MAQAKKATRNKSNNGATVGYEQQLWQMTLDAIRGPMMISKGPLPGYGAPVT